MLAHLSKLAAFLALLAAATFAQAAIGICPQSDAVGVIGIGDGCSLPPGSRTVLPEIGVFKGAFTESCNWHDKCYSTIGTNNDQCDNNFRHARRMLEQLSVLAHAQRLFGVPRRRGRVLRRRPVQHHDEQPIRKHPAGSAQPRSCDGARDPPEPLRDHRFGHDAVRQRTRQPDQFGVADLRASPADDLRSLRRRRQRPRHHQQRSRIIRHGALDVRQRANLTVRQSGDLDLAAGQ